MNTHFHYGIRLLYVNTPYRWIKLRVWKERAKWFLIPCLFLKFRSESNFISLKKQKQKHRIQEKNESIESWGAGSGDLLEKCVSLVTVLPWINLRRLLLKWTIYEIKHFSNSTQFSQYTDRYFFLSLITITETLTNFLLYG